jgi:hypothetical protein
MSRRARPQLRGLNSIAPKTGSFARFVLVLSLPRYARRRLESGLDGTALVRR